jgi:hypothetical protein
MMSDYGSQLKATLGKDGFDDVYRRLRDDKSIDQQSMVRLADDFNGPVAPSTSRTKALERIYSRHRKLMNFIHY